MEEERKPKQSLWRLIYPLLIFYGAGIIASIIFGVIFAGLAVSGYGADTINTVDYDELVTIMESYVTQYSQYITMLQNAIVIPAAIVFMNMDIKRLTKEGFYKSYEKPAIIFFVAAVVLGAASAITGNNLIEISGISNLFEEEMNSVSDLLYSGGIVAEIISICILAPIAEELVYRGLLYKRLRENSSFITALLISAIIFGLAHGNVPQGIYAFLIGLVCAFAMEKFKTVIAPICIHIGANVFSIIATETGILDEIYSNSTTYIAYVAISAVLVVLLIYLFYLKVEPKENLIVEVKEAPSDTPYNM